MENIMEKGLHKFRELFAQLGRANDDASIARFIDDYAPLRADVKLADAVFWTASQAAFLREVVEEDGDWAEIVDALDTALRG